MKRTWTDVLTVLVRVWTTKYTKGHERRERLSCISRPFVPFVFQTAIHKSKRLCAQQREAQRQAEHLFQTLLPQAFRGEL